ncbi:MAG: DUF2797 domain-containing protein [Natrialbaceae archaeon]|nr:DUF2797 domain-containing protein [Natrialbaceae archaeon]
MPSHLALFAPDTVKVGVTRTWRLQIRLREQGADRGAKIREVPDGRLAREIEAGLTSQFPDRVDIRTESRGAGSGSRHRDVGDDSRVLRGPRAGRPHLWPAPRSPAGIRDDRDGNGGGREGRLRAPHGSTHSVVDMRDLVGHEVNPDREPPARQSSLGAFDRSP